MFNKDFATFFWEYLHLYLQNSQHPKGKPDSASSCITSEVMALLTTFIHVFTQWTTSGSTPLNYHSSEKSLVVNIHRMAMTVLYKQAESSCCSSGKTPSSTITCWSGLNSQRSDISSVFKSDWTVKIAFYRKKIIPSQRKILTRGWHLTQTYPPSIQEIALSLKQTSSITFTLSNKLSCSLKNPCKQMIRKSRMQKFPNPHNFRPPHQKFLVTLEVDMTAAQQTGVKVVQDEQSVTYRSDIITTQSALTEEPGSLRHMRVLKHKGGKVIPAPEHSLMFLHSFTEQAIKRWIPLRRQCWS